MINRTVLQKDIEILKASTTFADNGDVDSSHSVVCCDDYGNILAAIIIGNITDHPTLGKAIPDE